MKEVFWKSSEETVALPDTSRRWHSPPSPWSYIDTPFGVV